MLDPRNTIIYYAVKYKGDWNAIYNAIKAKESPREEEVNAVLASLTCKAITMLDKEYPETLTKTCTRPPFVFFYEGDISLISDEKNCVAIVGRRDPSEQSADRIRKLCEELSEEGKAIVTGGARGTHAIALKSAAHPVCVLGCGLDKPYPKENEKLFRDVAKRGLLISEFPPDVEVNVKNLPVRNRLIAGLASKMLVGEAMKKSGTFMAVAFALQFNKSVGVILPYMDDELFNNDLLDMGAMPITSAHSVSVM